MAMSPEAQQLYDSIIAAGGTTQQAMAKVLRQFPREMMTALPAPSPGLLRGVAGATTGGGGFAPAAPRFTPAAPRFTPPPPRFAPGTTATTPAGAPPTPYAAPAAAMPRYPGSPASSARPGITRGEVAAGMVPAALLGGAGAYMAVPPSAPAREPLDPEIKTRNGRPVYFTGPSYDINSNDKYDYTLGSTPSEVLGSRRATASALDSANIPMPTGGSGRGAAPPSMEAYLEDRDKAAAANAALDAVRTNTSTPAQQAVQQARSMQQPDRQEQGRVNALFNTIFSGKDYQSSGGQLLRGSPEGRRTVNWGDPDSAADFFRADAAAQRLRESGKDYRGASGSDIDYQNRMAANYGSIKDDVGPTGGKAGGGAVDNKPTKEALLHKSLEIIHHMLKTR